jgi:MFS family permease
VSPPGASVSRVPRSLKVKTGLLAERSDLRRLFLATLASSIGTWLAFVALVIDVFDRTGSAAWVSALLVAEFLPLVVIGLLAAPVLDRTPRRTVLVASDLVRAAVFCIIPFTTSALQIVLLALVAGIATSFFRPAVYAGLPNLVPDAELPRANGLLQSAENVTLALGPVVGGILVGWVGPDPAYLFNAASFVASTLLIVRIRRNLEEGQGSREGHWRDVVEGLSLLKKAPAVRAVVVTWSLVMLGSAGVSVAEVVLAKDVFVAGDAGYGLMLSAMGVGLVVGSYLAGTWVDSRGVRSLYATSIAVMGLGVGAVAASPGVWLAAGLLVFAGFGNGSALVCNAVLIQRGVTDVVRGRAFTLAMSASFAALGVGMIASGPLTDSLGPREVWGLAAALLLVAAPLSLALTRGVRLAPPGPTPEPALPSQQGA